MKKEYEGLDFSSLHNSGWELLSYSISDDGQTGYFLLKSSFNMGVAFVKKSARLDAKTRGYLVTQSRYWAIDQETILPESMFNEVFGFLKSQNQDSDGLGEVLAKFTVGGVNP